MLDSLKPTGSRNKAEPTQQRYKMQFTKKWSSTALGPRTTLHSGLRLSALRCWRRWSSEVPSSQPFTLISKPLRKQSPVDICWLGYKRIFHLKFRLFVGIKGEPDLFLKQLYIYLHNIHIIYIQYIIYIFYYLLRVYIFFTQFSQSRQRFGWLYHFLLNYLFKLLYLSHL